MKSKIKNKYAFWTFLALTLFVGQIYVGYGYRLMHGSMLDLLDKVDGVLLHKEDRGPTFMSGNEV